MQIMMSDYSSSIKHLDAYSHMACKIKCQILVNSNLHFHEQATDHIPKPAENLNSSRRNWLDGREVSFRSVASPHVSSKCHSVSKDLSYLSVKDKMHPLYVNLSDERPATFNKRSVYPNSSPQERGKDSHERSRFSSHTWNRILVQIL